MGTSRRLRNGYLDYKGDSSSVDEQDVLPQGARVKPEYDHLIYSQIQLGCLRMFSASRDHRANNNRLSIFLHFLLGCSCALTSPSTVYDDDVVYIRVMEVSRDASLAAPRHG